VSFKTRDGRKLTYSKHGHGPVLICHPGGPGFSSLYFGDLAGLREPGAFKAHLAAQRRRETRSLR